MRAAKRIWDTDEHVNISPISLLIGENPHAICERGRDSYIEIFNVAQPSDVITIGDGI